MPDYNSDKKIVYNYFINALIVSTAFAFVVFVVLIILFKSYNFPFSWFNTLLAIGYLVGLWLGIRYSAQRLNQKVTSFNTRSVIYGATAVFGILVMVNAYTLLNNTPISLTPVILFSVIAMGMFYGFSKHYLKVGFSFSEESETYIKTTEERQRRLVMIGFIAIAIAMALVMIQLYF